MPTLLILILVLLVATCVIAYWSDNLGKKLGKKRISLFGLRPRQTATFISMGSSVGIMLLTLGVLLGLNASVRNALTRYDQTKKENTRLIANNEKLRSDRTKLATAIETAEAGVKSAQLRTTKAQAEAQQAQQKTHQVRQSLAGAQAQLSSVRTQLTSARQSAIQASQRATQAQAQVRTAQNNLRAANLNLRTANLSLGSAQRSLRNRENQLTEVTGRLAIVNTRLSKVQLEIDQKQAALDKTQQQLTKSQRALGNSQRALTSTQRALASTVAEFTSQINELETEQRRLETEGSILRIQQEQLTGQIDNLRQVKENLSEGRIEIVDGYIFVAQTVPAHVNREEARKVVQSLLTTVEETLSRNQRELQLVRVLPVGTSKTELPLEQLITLLIDSLNKSEVPVSVSLVADGNHAPGENPVRVRFVTIDLKTLVVKGAEITRTIIDSSTIKSENSDALIFGKLLDLLNAGEAKLSAPPYFASPVLTEEDRFNFWPKGTNERIFEALRRIQAADKPVEVRLVAATDIVKIGPMHIRFEVRELDS